MKYILKLYGISNSYLLIGKYEGICYSIQDIPYFVPMNEIDKDTQPLECSLKLCRHYLRLALSPKNYTCIKKKKFKIEVYK